MTLRRSDLLALVVAMSFAGYPLVSVLSAGYGLDNRSLSIAMRGTLAALALLLIIRAASRPLRPSPLEFAILGLLGLYGIRLAYQSLFDPESLYSDVSVYWIWFVGVVILPVVALIVTPYMNWRRSNNLTIAMFATAGFFASVMGSASVAGSVDARFIADGRAALASLNPISLGNIGYAIVTLSVWQLFGQVGNRWKIKLLMLAVMLLGIYIMFLAASRGPVASLAATFLVMGLSITGSRKVWFIVGSGIVFGVTAAVLLNSDLAEKVKFAGRMLSLIYDFNSDNSNIERLDIIRTSLRQISEYPLLGSSIENSVFRWYPHNLHLEFMLALGVFLGSISLVVMGILLVRATRLVRQRHDAAGFALLFVGNYVGAQFSGNVYSNGALWVASIVVVNALRPRRKEADGLQTGPISGSQRGDLPALQGFSR